ncbi:hypothetical protein EN745_13620 [Mesorhizobium sp. M4A.F.Ca.ET.022.05.2.1]|uniref:hypothetical protein n=1 Tax=Mesorhizobium sp. M4A.F.Ca.ET.022.05.2.1 TaxID=2496653 RepID=UPI000FCA2417|nr:hypothetical protein [Mesorhizobium sp. M4A.F.Ca.ET.022.05.2.1]RVC80208.1 hypothetical protein EN745_13620 [Mesorhizobium sp. M4A.F.Ca.ET.022.05.2.1]
MTKRPIIVDQRASDLAKVDSEIARLGKQIAEKQALFKADTDKHALDQSMEMQSRLKTEIDTIDGLIGQLRDKRFKIEIGEASEIIAPKPKASPVQHRAWEIDETLLRKQVKYPSVVRTDDNHDTFAQGLLDLVEICVAQTMDNFRKDGLHPDTRIGLDFACTNIGVSRAQFIWLGERCKALEARVKELEERPATQYRGVWANEETYKRGDMITHGGSTWHCELDASRGVRPGDGVGWRLMVKKGRDGRDATR